MIGWKSQRKVVEPETVTQKGFDDYDIRLGDILRGERATLGKSLLDVQRELRVKASYIQAIENCDPTVFDTPGFIAGYVRSYARYLKLDPADTFVAFCAESGFSTAHGLSDNAAGGRRQPDYLVSDDHDIFAEPRVSFAPREDSLWSRIEPAALASTFVLLALVAGIGYGGWSVLQEVQRVTLAPVDQTPVVLSDLDPVQLAEQNADVASHTASGVFNPPSSDAMDRLYRPKALDVPVVIARDAPISTLDPASVGSFAQVTRVPQVQSPESGVAALDAVDIALAEIKADRANGLDQAAPGSAGASGAPVLFQDAAPGVTVVAVREAWVRVRTQGGTTLFTGVMQPGQTYEVPQTAAAPVIRVGNMGAIYFAVNGQTYGPAGNSGEVANVALNVDRLTAEYTVADLTSDRDLRRVVAELNAR